MVRLALRKAPVVIKPVIRRATASDVAPLTETIRAAYAIYDGRGIALPPVWADLDQVIAETPVFVAEGGTDLLGVIVVRLESDTLQIENIAVRPEATGLGLARALMTRAETLARSLGIQKLVLATHRDLSENISLYQHLGWTVTARDGNKVLMEKTLTSA